MSPQRLLTAAGERWLSFWFRPASGVTLGICRVLFFASLLWVTRSVHWADWADVPDVFWKPIPITEALAIPRAGAEALGALSVIFRVALFFAALGLLTRFSVVTALLSGSYLLWLPHNFGKINHGDAVIILSMLILAFSRCGDSFSVDSWWRRRRSRDGRALASESPEYRWPVRLIQVLLTLVFFGAGVSKLQQSGIEWALSDNLANLMIRHHYSHEPPVQWGLHIAARPALGKAMGVSVLVMEIAAPLALFHGALAAVILPSLLLMQIGNWLFLGVLFRTFFVLYLFFVPWDAVLERLKALALRVRPKARSQERRSDTSEPVVGP